MEIFDKDNTHGSSQVDLANVAIHSTPSCMLT